MMTVCEIEEGVAEKIKKFRYRKEKTNAALIFKVKESTVVLDEELEDMSIEEMVEELPTTQPRFIILSYVFKHKDGRISYPLCFIFVSPMGCKNEVNMKYAGSKLTLLNMSGVSKCFELRSTEELTEEWLVERLEFFR